MWRALCIILHNAFYHKKIIRLFTQKQVSEEMMINVGFFKFTFKW